jgi:general secretion pathway protein D
MPFLADAGAADKLISLDLNQVDIRIFIKTVGQLTGVNFLVEDGIQGTVTLISPSKIRVGEVYRVLESVLQTKGYAAVPVGSLVKIVPRAEGVRSNLSINVGSDPSSIPADDSLMTQILRLQYADVAQVNTAISSLVSTGGQVMTFPETNTIIVTDTSSTVRRAALIVRELDVEGPQEGIEVVQLRYASANRISEQVTQIMQRGQTQPRLRPSTGAAKSPADLLKILPDDRTNSVVLVAGPVEMEVAKEIIARLDVERPVEASNIHVIYLEHAEAQEVEKAVSAALGRITGSTGADSRELFQITSDESTNSLIVVASPQDYRLVEDMVAKLDIAREQVLVEFQIVEADDNLLKELGFDWATLDEAVADSVRGFGFTNLGPRVEAVSGDLEGLGIGLWKEVDGTPEIGAILKALERNSTVNILSTPHVLTSNHQEAKIVVGENVPYVSQSRVTEFDPATPTAIRTFDFKDVGIELTVRPHVSGTDLVRLDIDASFSKLIEGTTGLGSETPTTAQRKATTTISIMSGSTVVIGGLMRDEKEAVEKKVPLLGDLPLVGGLFRAEREISLKTNLLLFITPHVLTDRDSLDAMTERKQREQRDYGALYGEP